MVEERIKTMLDRTRWYGGVKLSHDVQIQTNNDDNEDRYPIDQRGFIREHEIYLKDKKQDTLLLFVKYHKPCDNVYMEHKIYC